MSRVLKKDKPKRDQEVEEVFIALKTKFHYYKYVEICRMTAAECNMSYSNVRKIIEK
jgi:hypothetical protein